MALRRSRVTVHKQKWVLKLLLPVVVLLAFSAPLLGADAVKIMPVGDSITRGWYGSTGHWGYRKPLYDSLTNGSYDFNFVGSQADGSFPDPQHEGHNSWKADEILYGRVSEPGAGKLQNWLNIHQPDIVLLHIGTNDITAGDQNVASEVNAILDVIDNYEDANDKHVTVILALIINRKDYNEATTVFNNDVNNMAQNRIASGDDIVVVDMEHALTYPGDMYDTWHPNDNGYAKMADVWYDALVIVFAEKRILTCSSTDGGSVIQPGQGTFQYDDGTVVNLAATVALDYYFAHWTGTAVDAGRVADPNSADTTVTMDANYTVVANFNKNGLWEIDQRLEFRTGGGTNFSAFYNANGWSFDAAKDIAVKIDFHYSNVSMAESWIGISVGDDANYVSISTGSDSNASYFYYEAVVDGNVVSEKSPRASSDGTLYVSYDSALKRFYLSHTGFGSGNAYVWQGADPTQGQWSLPVYVSIGAGSSGAALGPGEAYLNNFEMAQAGLLDWPPATDIDDNGFIEVYDFEIMCENWLGSGAGDIDADGDIDFYDFTEFGLAW